MRQEGFEQVADFNATERTLREGGANDCRNLLDSVDGWQFQKKH
jgi:hypothetical protein